MACRHVEDDGDNAEQVRGGQPDVLSDWEGAQMACVDGDRLMISKGQDQDSASTQSVQCGLERTKSRASGPVSCLVDSPFAWRLAPPCCRLQL